MNRDVTFTNISICQKKTYLNEACLICFSHLRWNFVYQRPQHLMSRFAKIYTVLFVEDPIIIAEENSYLKVTRDTNLFNLYIIQPHISDKLNKDEGYCILEKLLNNFLTEENFKVEICWYYNPLSINYYNHFLNEVVVYDCMDELTAFLNAPVELENCEKILIDYADLVLTGGKSLYEAKKSFHKNVYQFSSGVDIHHFKKSKYITETPTDLEQIPHPRLGFYGVIDERFDINLLENLANLKPEWNFIIIGPVVKIDSSILPKAKNIFYLGKKTYNELPYYLANWDVALMLFALNKATKFISPTKTPEYLVAGKPVVSTPISDVVYDYQCFEAVKICDPQDLEGFVYAIEQAIDFSNKRKVDIKLDRFLENFSWDKIFNNIYDLIIKYQKNKRELA